MSYDTKGAGSGEWGRGIPPRVRDIIATTAFEHGFTPEELVGPLVRKMLSRARFDCWARIRAQIVIAGEPPSLPTIGRWFGGRDHTTVLYGLRRAEVLDCAPPTMQEAA